ncbi:MAG: SurA N-terminal domain-containing protein, partial [Roseimicrobium sp.]
MSILRVCFCASVSAIILLATGGALAETKSFGLAVVVNGKVITTSEVADAVKAQEQVIRMTIRDPNAAEARLKELRESALYALIERQLVLSEFEKLGGTIKAQYIDDDINNIIRESFEGNREKFLYELAKTDMTIKKFREQR